MGLVQVAHAYDTKLYATNIERAAKVRIGGNAASIGDKFVPNINMSKWDDEHWINLNLPIAIANQVETFDGEKVSITVGNYSLIYYPSNTNDLEFEIIFGRKPPVMTFSLDILKSEGLEYFLQPPLTQKEIDDGHVRADNVTGSYAVYCMSQGNKYCTGKFCHIYYPYLRDADGKTVRVDSFDISAGKMTIDLPSAWMETARYPVILDPYIGYSSVGVSSWANVAGMGVGSQADATGGVTTMYHCAIAAIGSPADAKMGTYGPVDSDLNPGLHARLEQTGEVVMTVSDDVNTTAGTGGTILANNYYFLAQFKENGTTALKYDTVASHVCYVGAGTYANQLVTPASDSWSSTTYQFSLWVDYAPPAAGVPIAIYKKYYDYRRSQ